MASTNVTIHAEESEIGFEYGGKDKGFENFSIVIREGVGDAYPVQDVCFFIAPNQRQAIAAELRKLADAIHPTPKAKAV